MYGIITIDQPCPFRLSTVSTVLNQPENAALFPTFMEHVISKEEQSVVIRTMTVIGTARKLDRGYIECNTDSWPDLRAPMIFFFSESEQH